MAQVLIETSARHVHLSKEHIEILFGAMMLTICPMWSESAVGSMPT